MKRIIGLLLVLVVIAAACGDDTTVGEDTQARSATEPATEPTDEAASEPAEEGDETVEPAASESDGPRIVSMSPTATETLFSIGAGDLVVAVDDQSTYPPEAPVTDLSGFGASVEAIAAHEPDLVVMWFEPGDVQAGLEAIGIEVLFQPAAVTLSDVYTQIEQLGAATGHMAEAAELVSEIEGRLADLVAGAPTPDVPLTYFHEIDNTLYTATSETFFGELYGLFGLVNIADPADEDGSSFGYPQLAEEFIVDADPDLIFLADVDFGESADTVAARPGWETLTAVRTGGIVELDGAVAGRWGPRIVDYVETIATALGAVVPA